MREDSRHFWNLIRMYHLRRVLDMDDPVDKQIYQDVKEKKLSFVFVRVKGEEK